MIVFTITYFVHLLIARRHIPHAEACAMCIMAHREHEDMALSDII